jgi:hypothetical protein
VLFDDFFCLNLESMPDDQNHPGTCLPGDVHRVDKT